MNQFKTLDQANVRNKTVMVRSDLNAPYDSKKKKIEDSPRFAAYAKTLIELARKKAKVVVLAHQGQKGKDDFVSLRQHASILSGHVNQKVMFVPDIAGPRAKKAIQNLEPGQILLLENVRFLPDETEALSPQQHAKGTLVRNLAPLADLFVNDAFSVSHRSHASVIGFTAVLPSFAGRVLEKELKAAQKGLHKHSARTILLFGGAKIDDCVAILEHLFERKKWKGKVLATGLLANLLLAAKGIALGKPSTETLKERKVYLISDAKKLLKRFGKKVVLPMDIAIEFNGKRKEIPIEQLPFPHPILDIGSKTIQAYAAEIKKAKIVIVKGPAGRYEQKGFEKGTKQLLQALRKSKAYSLIGGGDTTEALETLGFKTSQFSHVSLGGGAFITLLSGEPMPGIEALGGQKGKKP